IRILREDVFAMRSFELQVDHEERHRVARQKHQGGPVSGIPLPINQSDDLLPLAAERGNAEKDPRERDNIEDENSAGPSPQEDRGRRDFALYNEQSLDCKPDSV